MLSLATVPDDFCKRVAPFLSAHGFAGDCAIEPVAGGGNNRVYRVQTAERTGLLKAYFQNPADPRDRFGAEHAFYEYLWSQGVRRTPEPVGWDSDQRLGLFTFVTGRKLRLEEITTDHVGQALAFIAELNAARVTPAARQLPMASEACFSVTEHLACVARRVARLEQIESASALDREAAAFVAEELKPTWQRIKAAISSQTRADILLNPEQHCLSPSDFGFHNALLTNDGRLLFFDFEYAGWDDPAKLACDFFCQPQVPVAFEFCEAFLRGLAKALELDPAFFDRVRQLQPAYQVKWCCIMLNEFSVGDRVRRTFAIGMESVEARKVTQLQQARCILALAREAVA